MKDLINDITRIALYHTGNRRCYSTFDLPVFLIYAPNHAEKIAVNIMKIFMRVNMNFSYYSFINVSPVRYEKQFRNYCRSFQQHSEAVAFLNLGKRLLEKGTPSPDEISCYPIMGATVYLLPMEGKLTFAGRTYVKKLVMELERCGRKVYTLHCNGYDRHAGWNLCLQATEMMKGAQSEKLSKKHSENNDLTISKSEAHQLVDRLFSLEEARLKNEKLGVVDLL
jgi:hypothetical protein